MNENIRTEASAYPVMMDRIIDKVQGKTHFFDRSSMRFFDSRVGGTGYQAKGFVYFVTSEKFHGLYSDDGPRLYSVRRIDTETGNVRTWPDHDHFQRYETRGAAHREAQRAAKAAAN